MAPEDGDTGQVFVKRSSKIVREAFFCRVGDRDVSTFVFWGRGREIFCCVVLAAGGLG